MFRKILVPLDGSKLSEAVLPHVRGLAATGDCELMLLHVPDYPIYDEILIGEDLVSLVRQHVDADRRDYLSVIARDLQGEGHKVSCVLANGDVPAAILDWSKRLKADLIVMATHGRGGLERWLMGSVTEKVLQAAEIPLLVIRPRLEARG